MRPQTIPHQLNAANLISNIEQGLYCLPHFQRDYVWQVPAAAALVDSILRGYPIGSLILWHTREELRDIRNLGNIDLPRPAPGTDRNYVLDGQQRLTSLFAALKGLTVTLADGRTHDFSDIWVDLAHDDDGDICAVDISNRDAERCIRLKDLYAGDVIEVAERLPRDVRKTFGQYREALASYLVPYVQLLNAPVSAATDVFTRVNVGGKPLTVFEVMVAKTYDPERDFDLGEKWSDLIGRFSQVDFDTVDPVSVLHLAAAILVQDVRKTRILNLSKRDFIDIWSAVEASLKSAVDFVRQQGGMRLSRLMPYTSLLVPLAYFFHLKNNKPASADEAEQLIAYLYGAGWAGRFTGPLETVLNQDCTAMKRLVESGRLKVDFEVRINADDLIDAEFRAGSAFSKTIMAVLARQNPRAFDNHNHQVDLDNSTMQAANSKNFHHFFPKAFLKNNGVPPGISENSVVNITLVDAWLNKAKIKARAPSDYMAEFRSASRFLQSAATHFIDAGPDSPIWRDDYAAFLADRAARIAQELERLTAPLTAVRD
ncbi:MAG: DUF262 domain-containing protein [Paracoccus sp. (in: a-proteobacteria)]|uniref:DUF262 domain-containing protein n=1 Tax=Paracoccus sp. TaxID=267 RepID=UPI0026E07CDE|nr:DUF262 domain-containing protein [Paracoccus sp. (in: a-proteobacteria)]MDO5631189.1 DUF262 domain-containing protein [Paracoccus sp. (in: a-proteobacteria)]